MDRLRSMDVFAKIVASGSFAGAARQAQLSPTVVSKHVHALESWLGVRLAQPFDPARVLNRGRRSLL